MNKIFNTLAILGFIALTATLAVNLTFTNHTGVTNYNYPFPEFDFQIHATDPVYFDNLNCQSMDTYAWYCTVLMLPVHIWSDSKNPVYLWFPQLSTEKTIFYNQSYQIYLNQIMYTLTPDFNSYSWVSGARTNITLYRGSYANIPTYKPYINSQASKTELILIWMVGCIAALMSFHLIYHVIVDCRKTVKYDEIN